MIGYFIENVWLLWLIISVVCLTMEMCSGDFFITCLGVGALCAMISALIGVPFWVQVTVFAIFAVLSICFLRPRLLAMLHAGGKQRASNADALYGRIGEVTQTITAGDYGRVKIDGDDWKAQSDDAADIAVGDKVRVVGRESIILKVNRV